MISALAELTASSVPVHLGKYLSHTLANFLTVNSNREIVLWDIDIGVSLQTELRDDAALATNDPREDAPVRERHVGSPSRLGRIRDRLPD